jgi:hypothetical protein
MVPVTSEPHLIHRHITVSPFLGTAATAVIATGRRIAATEVVVDVEDVVAEEVVAEEVMEVVVVEVVVVTTPTTMTMIDNKVMTTATAIVVMKTMGTTVVAVVVVVAGEDTMTDTTITEEVMEVLRLVTVLPFPLLCLMASRSHLPLLLLR